jgi:hypothetical protein
MPTRKDGIEILFVVSKIIDGINVDYTLPIDKNDLKDFKIYDNTPFKSEVYYVDKSGRNQTETLEDILGNNYTTINNLVNGNTQGQVRPALARPVVAQANPVVAVSNPVVAPVVSNPVVAPVVSNPVVAPVVANQAVAPANLAAPVVARPVPLKSPRKRKEFYGPKDFVDDAKNIGQNIGQNISDKNRVVKQHLRNNFGKPKKAFKPQIGFMYN